MGNTSVSWMFPWVEVRNVASKVLSMAVRRLADDWEQQHGCRPVLVETFVNSSRFDVACYRAVNWIDLGETRGGKVAESAQTVSTSMPLSADFRPVRMHGQQRHCAAAQGEATGGAPARRRRSLPSRLAGTRRRGNRG